MADGDNVRNEGWHWVHGHRSSKGCLIMISDGDLCEIKVARTIVYKNDLRAWLNIREHNDIGVLDHGESVILVRRKEVLRNPNLVLVLTKFGLGVVYADVLR